MLYDKIRSKIVRQELELIEAGPHFKSYSAKVKYSPEHIEKDDFFNLCYGMLKKCDTIVVYTQKRNEFEMLYKYLVTDVDTENKRVTVRLLDSYNFMCKAENSIEDNAENLIEATNNTDGSNMAGALISNALITNMIGEALDKAFTENKILETIAEFKQYMTDTDDQLEELENTVAQLKAAPSQKQTKESTEAKTNK